MIDRERDPVVAQALRDLPVPEHAPGFWARLDDRLDAADRMLLVDDEPGEPLRPSTDPDRRLDTSELPSLLSLRPDPGPPREARLRFLAAAVVLAVVAIGTGLVLRGDGNGSGPGTAGEEPGAATAYADQPQAGTFDVQAPAAPNAPTLATPPEPIESMTATTEAGALRAGSSPEDAVLRWVDALGAGRTSEALDLLGTGTLRFLESQGGDVEASLREWAEGYGAWVSSRDLVTYALDVPEVGTVVVLQGTREAEGSLEEQTDAIPVVDAPGGWYVEPQAGNPNWGGMPQLAQPRDTVGGGLEGQDPSVVLRVDSTAPDATFWFSIDGEPFERDDDGVWDPPGELSSQTHFLVVAVTGERLFGAVAGEFVVEG